MNATTSTSTFSRSWHLRPAAGCPVLCWLRAALVLLALLGLGRPVMAGAEPVVSKEYQLKAAFLYNFTKFVEWPPGHFREEGQAITIGVFGRNPFANELEGIVKDRKVNGRAIVVKYLKTPDDARDVDLVFSGSDQDARFGAIIRALDGGHVVTVGESRECAARGAIITFTMEADKVRFEINQWAAEQAGLKISAQLLKLATVVRKRPDGA